MRILLATESFYPAVDSSTTTLKAMADRLIDLGHDVQIVAPGPGLASYRGARVVRVRPLEPTGAQVRAAIESFVPDLVQAHSPRTVGRKALKHARRAGVPTVAVEQSPVHDLAADYWRSKVAEQADTVLVTSAWMVQRAAELGVDAGLWRPGVDTRAFSPTLRDPWLHAAWSKVTKASPGPERPRRSRERPEPGRNLRSPCDGSSGAQPAAWWSERQRAETRSANVVVGYVGGLHRAAGVRRLADLAAVPGIRLVVIGAGPEREWLARRLPTDARFTGPLSTGDLTIAMPTLDVLVHPGEHETDCHPLREAAASGVPVVAPRSGGAREVVAHLESGVLYDPSDRRDLARAVASVAADPQRGLLGAAGRGRAGARSWVDAVDELIATHGHLTDPRVPAIHE